MEPKSTLVGRIRKALREGSAGPSAGVDAFRLIERLEAMRRAFPGDGGLLGRVGLSADVVGLLERAFGCPAGAGGGLGR
jgi:hypothetical protein